MNYGEFGIETEGETFAPRKIKVLGASGDSLVSIEFPFRYGQSYSFSFYFRNVFPGKYAFIWRASYRPSGYFEIYINDDPSPIWAFDLFDLRESVPSFTNPGERFFPDNNINMFDAWALVEEYGDVKVTLKYVESGLAKNNGFSIDYISLTRASE